MPARRSRTQHWRRGLEQILERRGSIDIAIARHYDDAVQGNHLVWRVQILALKNDAILIEQPSALGQAITVRDGAELVGVMTIGQNRWNFKTVCEDTIDYQVNPRRVVRAIRLKMPDGVTRCQRRSYYRMGTAELHLPDVDMWPLLDPRSIGLAERANEIRCAMDEGETVSESDAAFLNKDLAPELGPQFDATLLNLGGGGIGLRVDAEHGQYLARHKVFWLQFALPPEMPSAICATAKLAHTHVKTDHSTYAGMSFDFSYNPAHKDFVVSQIGRYIARQQANEMDGDPTIDQPDEHRRSA